MDHIILTGLRTILAFLIMMVIARILGKSTISQMTYHDFVAAITLGAFTANIAFNTTISLRQLLTAFLMFGGIAFLLMIVALRSRPLRKWISGQPTILIQDGKIMESNMRKLKITLDTLNQELREKFIFNIEEVHYAVLELNGRVSVLRKPEYLPVTRKDMNIPAGPRTSFPIELIMDGKTIEDNFQQNGITKEWLVSQAKVRGLALDSVNYAVISSNGHLFFDSYEDRIQHPVDQE
ncbi:DUF421 domain-containing protein [Paenibacillus sp. PR3]|uniref:DUF421 domain-containing protein n=1 Tax=Paenibacillus terricola TaxID=2763503 RepID=A0ABR8N4G9_9BACL|nr:DUF421 domain-containing protein [Paenibacillus terricola]MBD3922110.1 DUF421 domain-containing protein [Paenibacillus terricola]